MRELWGKYSLVKSQYSASIYCDGFTRKLILPKFATIFTLTWFNSNLTIYFARVLQRRMLSQSSEGKREGKMFAREMVHRQIIYCLHEGFATEISSSLFPCNLRGFDMRIKFVAKLLLVSEKNILSLISLDNK